MMMMTKCLLRLVPSNHYVSISINCHSNAQTNTDKCNDVTTVLLKLHHGICLMQGAGDLMPVDVHNIINQTHSSSPERA
jgi:hypothetical protein